jgi:dipeptidyl aminopeptidase/acylaminoacyl peptidase
VDVNYRGSSGYGRAYREALNGAWGIIDVDDCSNAALYLVKNGDADPNRLAITGGSAGGFTALAALTFKSEFHAGCSKYGIGDLLALERDTHKFEAYYLDSLIGPYPQRMDLMRLRSPIFFAEQLSCPIIFFQGLEDKVVPPNQSQMMVDALKQKGIPCAYVAYANEGHGFRDAANIKRTLEAELYFYGRIFRFEPSDRITPVDIENLS